MHLSPHPSLRRVLGLLAAVALTGGVVTATSPAAVAAPAAPLAHTFVVGGTDLGPNVYLFTPDMAQSDIQATVDGIAAEQLTNQFGTQRYELLFAPGTYGTPANPLVFQVGYYTDVAGLGQSPGDVTINGSVDVYNQCDTNGSCLALNNFWRSLSNLTIVPAGGSGCQANTEFWAVSQAASMRRVAVTGPTTFMDYCTGPSYASGGFVADSAFGGNVVNGSQQQFVVRNSSLNGWTNGVWNQVFVGTQGAPGEAFGPHTNQYTTVATTPIEQEKPYLYLDGGALSVFVPSSATGTSGTTWANGPTPGTSLPLSSFFVATPASTTGQINRALAAGKNLILTPGVYTVTQTIRVTRANTVVLGLGLATLVPANGVVTMKVTGAPGVKISDLIFDAGTKASSNLLVLAASTSVDPAAPTLVQDVYFRVGGATPGSVGTAFVVGASNVVLDNTWVWRADHGAGVGWTSNTARTGLQVTGADVTAYGLFVEHFQGTEVAWNGPRGRVYMFQNEMPYDVPDQASWMSSPQVKGYSALNLGSGATGFAGYGLGSYCFFNQGVDIHATQAFSAAKGLSYRAHDLLTVFLDGSGGIDSVINGVGAPVNSSVPGTPSDVIGS